MHAPHPLPPPSPAPLQVTFVGVNQLDLIQARGGYKLPEGASETLGLEVSGTVVQVGKECQKGFADGDEVIALLQGGGYAEFVSVDERTVMPAVPELSQAENAGECACDWCVWRESCPVALLCCVLPASYLNLPPTRPHTHTLDTHT